MKQTVLVASWWYIMCKRETKKREEKKERVAIQASNGVAGMQN
jgi:hypothetical protein